MGVPGIGKTALAAQFPNAKVFYDPQEPGVLDLLAYRQLKSLPFEPVELSTFDEFVDVGARAGKLAKEGVQTAVFDALSGIEYLCFQHHCDMYFDGDWSKGGFYAYQQGPKNAAKTDWPRFLDACRILNMEGISVVLIAHTQIKTHQNPLGADYDRFVPALDKETWAATSKWASSVFFYNYHFMVAQQQKGDDAKNKKGKAQEDSLSRMLFTTYSPAYEAKNRYGLEPWIEMGDTPEEAYQNFTAAFNR